MIKNQSSQRVGCQMVSATDGSAFTGSVTVAVTVDAGTQATGSVGSGACTHEGNGYHTYAPAQAETNGDLVAFTFTGTGAVPVTVQVYTRAGDAFTRLGAPANASIAADIAAAKVDTAAIKAKTDNLPSDPADASDITAAFSTVNTTLATLATATDLATVDTVVDAIKAKTDLIPAAPAAVGDIPTAVQNADALLGRNIAGGSSSGRIVSQALYALRNKATISGGTLTVYGTDDSTSAWTATVSTAAGNPISAIDPA